MIKLVLVRVIKSLVLAHLWFNTYAPELLPIFYYRDKTRVEMFYFLRITLLTLRNIKNAFKVLVEQTFTQKFVNKKYKKLKRHVKHPG